MSAAEYKGVKVEDAPERARPKCPYCNARLDKLWVIRKGLGVIEQKQVVICPHCEAFLGYGTLAH